MHQFHPNEQFKTGEKAPRGGIYRCMGHTTYQPYCRHTLEEWEIPLSMGETFPPHASCKTGVYWQLVRLA